MKVIREIEVQKIEVPTVKVQRVEVPMVRVIKEAVVPPKPPTSEFGQQTNQQNQVIIERETVHH